MKNFVHIAWLYHGDRLYVNTLVQSTPTTCGSVAVTVPLPGAPVRTLLINRRDYLRDGRGQRRYSLQRMWSVPNPRQLFLRSEWAMVSPKRLTSADRSRVVYDSASSSWCKAPDFDMALPHVAPTEALWHELAAFGVMVRPVTGYRDHIDLPLAIFDRIAEVQPELWELWTAPPHESVIERLKRENA